MQIFGEWEVIKSDPGRGNSICKGPKGKHAQHVQGAVARPERPEQSEQQGK